MTFAVSMGALYVSYKTVFCLILLQLHTFYAHRYGPRVTFAVGMGALILGDLTLLMSGTYPMAVFGALLFLGVHWAVIQVRAWLHGV